MLMNINHLIPLGTCISVSQRSSGNNFTSVKTFSEVYKLDIGSDYSCILFCTECCTDLSLRSKNKDTKLYFQRTNQDNKSFPVSSMQFQLLRSEMFSMSSLYVFLQFVSP